ncbi:MAG: hypothetical protein ACRC3Z_06850 [Phocaeicola sp.]
MLHPFTHPISSHDLPRQFTFPFCYTPHPLCVEAAERLKSYLITCTSWSEELSKGKMFGVLIVRTSAGEIGYLAAFSGILAGSNRHDYFVPPVYDLLHPDGHFRKEGKTIGELSNQIEELEKAAPFLPYQKRLEAFKVESRNLLAAAKKTQRESKILRDRHREWLYARIEQATGLEFESLNKQLEMEALQMAKHSQYMSSQCKQIESINKQQILSMQEKVNELISPLQLLKAERKERSAHLQHYLFEQFVCRNARGEEQHVFQIFNPVASDKVRVPPAGTAECAGPKLLQYAYVHGLEPLAMAEFWWGESPKKEPRTHGHYYPACQSKCEPVLGFMLQGLDVEKDPNT